MQFSLVPPIVPKERKAAYYRYLELVQTEEKYDNLEQFIAETIVATSDELIA